MKPRIRCNDNLSELQKIPDASVDLVYLDPPFNTGKHRGDYDDQFDSMNDYLKFMKPRLEEARRVLKPTGSLYLHSDHHASHHLRILLDDIFGDDNFVNEIIWSYESSGRSKTRRFARKHDTIFLYGKTKDYKFNMENVLEPYSDKTLRRARYNKNGERFDPIRDKTRFMNRRGKLKPIGKGKIPSDVFSDINPLPGNSNERVGYDTQKPEKLLERIILASSNENDVVLDAFAGSGTTCSVSKKLGRKSICIDKNQKACNIMEERLQ